MSRILLIIFALATSSMLFSQSFIKNRCPYEGTRVTDSQITKLANDFTITTTDGITRNLFNTLDSGKTVFIDLFYTTCYWCQYYSPIVEEIYQNHGAGQGDIEFWGISNNPYDTNSVIDQYRLEYNISNPCAGPWGGGTTALSVIIDGQNFLGFPTYCVICPDRTLFFDPCYPPTLSGFDAYFTQCATTSGIVKHNISSQEPGIHSLYPNPAKTELSIGINVKDPVPVTIEFYNLLGIKVLSSSFEVTGGSQFINVGTTQLPNGAYFIRLTQNSQFIDTKKAWISR